MGGYNFDWSVTIKYLPLLLMGLKTTIFVSLLATIFGSIIGSIVGITMALKIKILSFIFSIYIHIIRGIPLLVFLLYIYFGFGSFVNLSAMVAAISGLAIFSGAYVAEIVRGGIESVPRGQWDAAKSIGLSKGQQMRIVILPQSVRVILPALVGQFIMLIKDSSLVSAISVVELTLISKNLLVRTFQPFEIYTITAVCYISLTYFLAFLAGLLEHKFKKYNI